MSSSVGIDQAQALVDDAPRAVVVFDFDGTLVGRDSFLDFAVGYCFRRPWRLLLIGAMAPFALVLALLRSRTTAAHTALDR